jgi:hypothetical protein
MGRNRCIISDLYISTPQFPLFDPGRKIGTGLELAWRNNLARISAIPPETYQGFVRTDGPLGWRIELTGVVQRTHIQIHLGNQPVDTHGCILVGQGTSSDAQCTITDSATTMNRLRAAYGSSHARVVVLKVES